MNELMNDEWGLNEEWRMNKGWIWKLKKGWIKDELRMNKG